jgi:hypothetical protein
MQDMRFSRYSGWARKGVSLLAAAAFAACGILDTEVENPNVVVQEDVEKPAAASALVGGALLFVTEGMGQLAAAHATVSDEATWRGSFDVIGAFDRGELQHNDNLYSTAGYTELTQGRWLADESVRILTEHDANGDLSDRSLLATAYWLAGLAKTTGAEVFEAFAKSDRRDAGGVVDRNSLFDEGIGDLGQAVSVAQSASADGLATAAMAYQARAYWARALHQVCSSAGCSNPPLINDSQANNMAATVLAAVGEDWQHVLQFSATTEDSRIGFEINSRREIVIENHIIQQSSDLRQSCWPGGDACSTDGIQLMDPIDDIQDPALQREAWTFLGSFIYPDFVGVSARELRLILAEAALAGGDMNTFATHINAVRGLEASLTAFDAGNPAHTAIAEDLLIHMRQVNLFLQLNRRLMDMYRFDIAGPEWLPGNLAVTAPGTVLPLGDLECDSNPEVDLVQFCN